MHPCMTFVQLDNGGGVGKCTVTMACHSTFTTFAFLGADIRIPSRLNRSAATRPTKMMNKTVPPSVCIVIWLQVVPHE